ncbi:TIGR03087 family PEP-CTERM/XrtA system glycosyltransferase [Parahaliea sp. F7430]|uniref:TIGR03087 family PEP-CTERM/XrtA system glycosyltransferase n=1 Tax=Sediminihaliea albiluteola TaxID=2758564 RepID=A0A7W2TVL5_9GAMM|nr:TIGR03087 family PEP-CTERM/XrtA system glycosyltransferase [Sediminihaliea albiluteola]MBA6412708.1 TIGR03087 family PEP-CTERM/XrtA system glycosyltransferase [Sediminihaliea albiluteola]
MAIQQPGNDLREPLLLLCHRIPYPPDKGDKIRSFHLLNYLSEQYAVCLATFVDDPNDWQYQEVVESYCHRSLILPRRGLPHLSALLAALYGNQPLTLPLYFRRDLANWITSVVTELGITRALIYSSGMGQYLKLPALSELHAVVDFVDVDSDKWRQYAETKVWPLSWLYRREARTLLEFEKSLNRRSAASLFVSAAEAEMFRSLQVPEAKRVSHYNNGVDGRYFCPDDRLPNPFKPDQAALVFTGAMDYWPNIDAVVGFAKEVFPVLLKQHPELLFYIVGSNPDRSVKQLAVLPNVFVTGRVPDVRPYLQHSLAAVAPLRVARGIQNKVLEAMAMARPVLVSPAGLEGIPAIDGQHVLLAGSAEVISQRVAELIEGDWQNLGLNGRELVLEQFSWSASLPLVDKLLQRGAEIKLMDEKRALHDY